MEIVCEEKANLTRLKRVRRKEGGLGSDSLWKGHSEARSVCEKMDERWFWNEELQESYEERRRKCQVSFFPSDFTTFTFETGWGKLSSRQKLSLNFHCFQLPATLETPQGQALTVIQHICLWLQA